MFDPGLMAYDCPGPAPDRLLVARLDGIAKRHARWRKPTEPEIAAAASEFREVAGNRADLLAEVAGVLLGASEGRLDEPRARARGPAVHCRRCRREHDPAVDRGGTTPGRAPAASSLQPARSYTTAALNASGRCGTGGSSGVAATVGHAQALALRWSSWRAQATPRGDHRPRLSQHGRLCVRILRRRRCRRFPLTRVSAPVL
jgi:hypothetical protein